MEKNNNKITLIFYTTIAQNTALPFETKRANEIYYFDMVALRYIKFIQLLEIQKRLHKANGYNFWDKNLFQIAKC